MTTAERLADYENLFNQSQQYNPAKYQEDFDKAYGEAVNYNKPVIEDRNNAIAQLQTLPSELRNQYYAENAVRNPLQQEALIAQRRAPISSEIGSLTDLLTARKARQQDVYSSQASAYAVAQQQAQQAAENAWRLYQDQLAQDEAVRARAAAAAQQQSYLDSLYGQQVVDTGVGQDDIVIDTGNEQGWFDKLANSSYTKPINNNQTGITNNPFTTFTNLVGNYLGNTKVPKRENMSFWDKLLNR